MRDETGAGSPAEMGYSVTLASPTRLDDMIVCSSNGSRQSAWGTWGKLDEQVYHFDTFYADGLPAGQVTCGFDFMRSKSPGCGPSNGLRPQNSSRVLKRNPW